MNTKLNSQALTKHSYFCLYYQSTILVSRYLHYWCPVKRFFIILGIPHIIFIILSWFCFHITISHFHILNETFLIIFQQRSL